MASCPACGYGYEGGFRFCPDCSAPLSGPARGLGEERKVVTALFCDLVGFTSISESADPEDIDRMLGAYFAMAQAQIEGHGGVVEKFIGDAVVGAFGVPSAHEDDAERAVRAGLRIAEAAERLRTVAGEPLRLRIGINTGEVLVRLGVSPGSGQGFLVGDAVNTASRLQSVAPEMGVAVGLATYEATAPVFEYVELEPAVVKGKSEPVRVFHAVEPKARLGTDITRSHDGPFIGREIDLALLKGNFDKAVAAESVQLVTVVGEPGLGKSRIVAELFGYVDGKPNLVTWRQGRCLAYGEGITFWALGEIVKAHAGILESDPPHLATAKLDAVLPEGDERAWFRQRLLPLLGIEASSTAGREELFTAWRRFLEHIAEERPTVLVFEDLHWADAAMLAFIEHLADRAEGVPLLLVGTARPELFERHPTYAAGLSNVNRVNLVPLSEAETGRLISTLAVGALPADLRRTILDRAGGNPFYAGEFVRLVKDQELLVAGSGGWELQAGVELTFPDSVQALIAARLDTMTAAAKSLLADAAVVGKVFWAGAVAAMGGRPVTEVLDTLRELSRKELVRVSRRSSIEGETEYNFWHVLTRDVAYAQLPRASRAARHVAAAAWIESVAPERVEDMADVLAYHYATALELALAAGQDDQAVALGRPALRFLTLAGERALGLDTNAALTNFERALALTPPGHPLRAQTLVRFGRASYEAGRYPEAAKALDEAIDLFAAGADPQATAAATIALVEVLFDLGDPRCWALPAEAVALVEHLEPGPVLVAGLVERARAAALQAQHEPAIHYAQEAVALATSLGMDPPARALGYRGMARTNFGDAGGMDDYRAAIERATQAGQGRDVAVLQNNYGMARWVFDGPAAALQTMVEGVALARSRGLTAIADATEGSTLSLLFDVGRLDELLELAAGLAERFEASENVIRLIDVRGAQARALVLRGQAQPTAAWLDWLESSARGSGFPEVILSGLASAALARAALDQPDAARALLTEIDRNEESRGVFDYAAHLPGLVRAAAALGDHDLAQRLATGVEPRNAYLEHAVVAAGAALAESRGDLEPAVDAYADAGGRWERFGVVREQGFALLGQGRCQAALGRTTEATDALAQAGAIFARLGAGPALSETEAVAGPGQVRR